MNAYRSESSSRLAVAVLCAALAGCAGAPAEPVAADPPAASSRGEGEPLRQVRELIAGHYGIDPGQVTAETDLLTDLPGDAMTALDALASVCEAMGVVAPQGDELTVVADIVDYLAFAPTLEESSRGEPGSQSQIAVHSVFYGTDREATDDPRPETHFSRHRSSAGRIHYGIAEVTIPVDVHRPGEMERPGLWTLSFSEDPRKHIVLRSLKPMNRFEFLAALERSAGDSPQGREAFVFIHGFRVRFAEAARRTAQIAQDLGFAGIPILYSWPADTRASPAAYASDREDVEWSVAHIESFLGDLLARENITRLHLIAHSMGNQGLLRTLQRMALRDPGARDLFDTVILAAADFDAHYFSEQVAPTVAPLARSWTIYASDKDKALDLSASLSHPRLGQPIATAKGMDSIDASGIEITPWSVPEFHSYYASKARVIDDLRAVIRGRPPQERALKPRRVGGHSYWQLGADSP